MIHIPTVFYHGRSFNLVTFGLYAAIGSMTGYSIAFFYLYSMGIPVRQYCWEIVLVLVFSNLIFAKLFSIFSIGRGKYFKNLRYHLNETSFYQQGGVIGFIIGTLCLYHFLQIPFFLLSDAVCLGGIASMFIGRLGCFNYGCCVGKPTKRKYGIAYTDPEAKICRDLPGFTGTPLIPVQLIAAFADFLLFSLCCIVIFFYSYSGLIMIIFFFGVNIKRIALQTMRWKDSSNRIPYQWVAFALIITITLIIFSFRSSGEIIFAYEKSITSFTIGNYFSFLSSERLIILSLFFVGVLNFSVYGIHGKKLGTHFNIKQ